MFGHLLPRLTITAFAILISLLPAAAGERFTDNGDGTITDHELRLMWSKTDNNGDIDFNFDNVYGSQISEPRLPGPAGTGPEVAEDRIPKLECTIRKVKKKSEERGL